jgi:hypothetical protein
LAKASPNLDLPRVDGSGIRLNGLYVYPIKSCDGVAVGEWYVDERGLRHDRRWMLVDEAGRFMSQRRFPRMALIGARSVPDGFVVSAPGMPSLEVPLRPPNGKPLRAQIWNDTVDTLTAGGEADRWFGEFLGVRSKLVHMPDESVRPVDPDYGEPGDLVGLTDSFPFLLISEGSLAALNARLEHPLPMNRFRPNLVVVGRLEDGAHRPHNLPRGQAVRAVRDHHRGPENRRHGQGAPAHAGDVPAGREEGPVRTEPGPQRDGHLARGRPLEGLTGPVDSTPTTARRGEKVTLC